MIDIRPADIAHAAHIIDGLREQDYDEINAVVKMPYANLARHAIASSPDCAFIAYLDNEPAAMFGISTLLSHVGQGWAFGTDKMRRTVPAMTRHGLNVIVPTLKAKGFHRIEVRTFVDHDLSHKWLAGMGAINEGICRSYGRHREDFALYALTF